MGVALFIETPYGHSSDTAMALLRQFLRGRGEGAGDEDSGEEERLLQVESDASTQSEEDTQDENAVAEGKN